MSRENKVKSILITQPPPEPGKNIYEELAKKHKLKLDFRSFIHIEPLTSRELRKQRVNILEHTAIIFNSRNAVDNFFNVCTALKVEMPPDMKYFSLNESISNYVQKYIVLRKRKMFCGKGTEKDFLQLCKSHAKEKYLFPCSDIRKPSIPDFFKAQKLHFTEFTIYRTVSSDLSDLADVFYDILVFFSPADIKSLYDNFPDFKQNLTRIAGFGDSTQKAILEHDLILDIPAPTPDAPSMVAALEAYIKRANAN
jgi:uroporphyrinogen-III synthase